MKKRLTGYTFDASAKTVVHADFSDLTLEGITMIINTTDNEIIYDFVDPLKGGTLSTDTLTLTYDTTSMSDTDKLMVLVEDGTTLATSGLALESGGNLDTINGHVDAAETLLTSIDASATSIANSLTDPATETTVASILADTATIDSNITDLTKAEDAQHVSGDKGIMPLSVRKDTAAALATTDGNYAPLETDSVGRLHIRLTQTNIGEVTLGAGTAAIGKLAANSGVDIGDVTLTAGTAAIGTLLPPDIDVTAHTNYAKKYYTNSGAVTDGIIWSPAAGKRWHVVSLFIQVSAAATVTLEDDKAGGDEAVMKMELAANSGITIPFPEKYPLASGEDAADLIITTSAGNVYVTCVGYEI